MKLLICLTLVGLIFVNTQGAFSLSYLDQKTSHVPGTNSTETIQRFVNGLAKLTGKPQPDLTPCIDPESGDQTVQLLEDIFSDVANGNLASVPGRVNAYKETVRPEFLECVGNNVEFGNILVSLNVKDVPLEKIYLKFAEYALTGNYDPLVAMAKEVEYDFGNELLEEAGTLSGALLKTVMNYKRKRLSNIINLSPIVRSASFLERVLRK